MRNEQRSSINSQTIYNYPLEVQWAFIKRIAGPFGQERKVKLFGIDIDLLKVSHKLTVTSIIGSLAQLVRVLA